MSEEDAEDDFDNQLIHYQPSTTSLLPEQTNTDPSSGLTAPTDPVKCIRDSRLRMYLELLWVHLLKEILI